MIPLSKIKTKYIKSLQFKKSRDKENKFIVEGKKSVLEFIESGFTIELIIGTEEFYAGNELPLDGIELLTASTNDLNNLGTLKTNNAALAVIQKQDAEDLSVTTSGVILALDNINDPGNLGTIIRTADWFGIKDILLNIDSVDVYNPKVVNSTKGSFCRVSVHEQSLAEFLSAYKGEVYAADMIGKELSSISPISHGIIMMGSESHGISKSVAEYVTQKITIPAIGGAESLNVGVATGIICYHMLGKG